MALAVFVVPWRKVNQAIVAVHSFKRKNPEWTYRLYVDDVLTLHRLGSAFGDTVEYAKIDRACPVAALDDLLKQTTEDRACLIGANTVCNRPIVDVAKADLTGQDVVVRPDRPFELTPVNALYVNFDPHHSDRLVRSLSYFTLGLVVFNLTRLRENPDWVDLDTEYTDRRCPDKGRFKHFLNRKAASLKKGLLPGSMLSKPETTVEDRLSYSMCLRHHVRLRETAITNFAGPVYPWTPDLKSDRVFMQIPFRSYLNRAAEVKEHLDEDFYLTVKENTRRWLDRYGKLDDAFFDAFDIEVA